MGRPPKPKSLKELEGTYRKDRHAPNMPEIESGIPEPPEGFAGDSLWGEEALAEYWRMAEYLRSVGLLAVCDRAAFLAYCDSWGKWLYYRRQVKERGDTVTSSKGNESRAPWAIQEERAKQDLKKWLSKFGLSPSDRTRVTTTGGQPEVRNAFEEFREA